MLLAWSRRAFVVAVGLGIVGAFVSGMLVSPALAYLATFTRAAELLVGAALALLLHRIRVRPSAGLSIGGFGALAAVVAAFAFIPLDWSPLFQGGLLAFAVVVALLVTAAVTPGPVASVLSLSPLVWLGLRSYGVYLYHWPLYLVFENQGWSTWWALLTTLAVAEVSFRVLEQPVRTGAWPRRGQAKILAPTAVALVGVAAFVVAPVSGTADDDLQVLATATLPTSVPAPVTTAADITLPSTSVVSSAGSGPSTSVTPRRPPPRPLRPPPSLRRRPPRCRPGPCGSRSWATPRPMRSARA